MIFILTLVVTRSHIISEGDEERDEDVSVVEMVVGDEELADALQRDAGGCKLTKDLGSTANSNLGPAT